MRADYINPFIASLQNAFSTMLHCDVRRGAISLKDSSSPTYEISGIVGLSGKAVGTVVVSFSEAVAIKAASVMLLHDTTEVNADVVDAAGELTNMVAGGAKAKLEEYELSVSLPNVVTGRGHEVRFPSDVTPICVQFETDWGPMALEVGLTEVPAAVTT